MRVPTQASLSATPTPRKKTEAVSRRETRKDEGISPHFYFQENDDSLKIKHITLYDQEGYIPVWKLEEIFKDGDENR